MEFTQPFSTSFGIVNPSPLGKYVAIISQQSSSTISKETSNSHLLIHETGNGSVWRRFPISMTLGNGNVDLFWSQNGELIALVYPRTVQIAIFALHGNTDQPIATIKENSRLGVSKIVWCPDSHHILIILKHHLGIRVWNIFERLPKAIIDQPKYLDRGLCFSGDGRWMAVLCRRKCQYDAIVVFDLSQIEGRNGGKKWESSAPENANLCNLSFVPLVDYPADGEIPPIIAWEAPAWSDKLFIFHRSVCRVISPATVDSLQSFGYESLVWSPIGWIGALIQDHRSFRLWNGIANKLGASLSIGLEHVVVDETVIFREKINREVGITGAIVEKSTYEPVFSMTAPQKTPPLKKDAGYGPLQLSFSPDSAYIAAHSAEYATCIWIFNVSEMSIVAVLYQLHPIQSFVWHDRDPILMLLTAGHGGIFVWQPSGCLCVPQPAVSDAKNLHWLRRRETLIIAGTSAFSLATPEWATY